MSDPAHRGPPDWGLTDSLRIGVLAGLLTGVMEVGLLLFKRFLRHRFILVGDDAFWMAPLAELCLFSVFVLLLVPASRLVRDRPRMVLSGLAGLGIATVLSLWGRLNWIAVLLLAVGGGLQAGRILGKHRRTVRRMAPRAILGVLVLVGLSASTVFGTRMLRERRAVRGVAPPGSLNVLLIILDTVRSASLGLYGYERSTTPHLERWAGRGTVFDVAFSPSSWTLPSHASMFTGRWPNELSVGYRTPLDDRDSTLAEILSSNGYATGGMVANLLFTTRETGIARGFGHYVDHYASWGEFLRSATLIRKLVDGSRLKWMTRRWTSMSWKGAGKSTGRR